MKDNTRQNSHDANVSMEKHKSRICKIIMSALSNMDGKGTKDEIARFTCLTPDQVHKRMSDLKNENKVQPNGKKLGDSGRSITIWKIS